MKSSGQESNSRSMPHCWYTKIKNICYKTSKTERGLRLYCHILYIAAKRKQVWSN